MAINENTAYFPEDFKNLLENVKAHMESGNNRAAGTATKNLVEAYKSIGVEKDAAIKYIRGGLQDGNPRFPEGFKFPDATDSNEFRNVANPLEDTPKAEPPKKSSKTLTMDEVKDRLSKRKAGLGSPPQETTEEKTARVQEATKSSPKATAVASAEDVAAMGYKDDLYRQIKNLEEIKGRFPRVNDGLERLKEEYRTKFGELPEEARVGPTKSAKGTAKAASVPKAVTPAVQSELVDFSGIVDRMSSGETPKATGQLTPTQSAEANVRFNPTIEGGKLQATQPAEAKVSFSGVQSQPINQQTEQALREQTLRADKTEPSRPSGGLQGEPASAKAPVSGTDVEAAAQDLEQLTNKYGPKVMGNVLGKIFRFGTPMGALVGTMLDSSEANTYDPNNKGPLMPGNDPVAKMGGVDERGGMPTAENFEGKAPTTVAASPSKSSKPGSMRNFSSYELEKEINTDKTGVSRAAFIGQVHLPANAPIGDVIQYARLAGVNKFEWGGNTFVEDKQSNTGYRMMENGRS